MRAVFLESTRHLHCNADRRDQLRDLQGLSPFEASAQRLIWNHDHVAGLHGRVERAAAEKTLGAGRNCPIGANDEDVLLIRRRSRAASLMEIPARTLTRPERNCRLVI